MAKKHPTRASPVEPVDWHGQFNDILERFLKQSVRQPADRQDIAQEIFLRLLRVKNQQLIQSPRAYLYRVAAHVLHEWRAQERLINRHSSDELNDLLATESCGDSPESETTLIRLLNRLPATYRAVLILHWHHGMTYGEIAREMAISPRRVKRYITKGYAALRMEFERNEATGMPHV